MDVMVVAGTVAVVTVFHGFGKDDRGVFLSAVVFDRGMGGANSTKMLDGSGDGQQKEGREGVLSRATTGVISYE